VSANDPAGEPGASTTPAEGARRVALLARPGQACDNLRAALQQAGGELVLEADPTTVHVQAVVQAAPQVVLVALDAATEDVLSRLDSVLHGPGVTVLYEEADLAAAREGWEAQRWTRHLAAKLHGHRDVLPPGTEAEGGPIEHPGQAGFAPSPVDAGLAFEGVLPGFAQAPRAESSHEPQGLYLDLEPEAWQPRQIPEADAAVEMGFGEFIALDDETAMPPAPPAAAHAGVDEGELLQADAPEAEPVPAPVPGSGLTLELEALEPVAKGEGARGALLLFAGIGGPDAVRKVLAELPPDLPTPVLVRLRLDGGRYDNLVKQMARITDLPVELAKAGEPALAGHVFVLPNDVAMQVSEGVVVFSEGEADLAQLIATLPPALTAILLLSGSDTTEVEPALALAAKGAFVAGQVPQGCYDPAASKALIARGGEVGTPDELATRVVAHLAP